MHDEPKYPCEIELTGEDGNAIAIVGRARKVLRRHLIDEAQMTSAEADAEVTKFTNEATRGNYEALIATVERWMVVS